MSRFKTEKLGNRITTNIDEMKQAVQELLDSADSTGCDGDVTVVVQSALDKLAEAFGL